jgi:hypothetical protein
MPAERHERQLSTALLSTAPPGTVTASTAPETVPFLTDASTPPETADPSRTDPTGAKEERRAPLKWEPPSGRPVFGFEIVRSGTMGLGLRATRFFEKDDEVVGFHEPYRLTVGERRRYHALLAQVEEHLGHGGDGEQEWRRIAPNLLLDGRLRLHHWDMVLGDGCHLYTDMFFARRLGTPEVRYSAWYYLNHSKTPNLVMTSVGPMARKVIKFKAKRRISVGEILAFDYKKVEGGGWIDPNILNDWTPVPLRRPPVRAIAPRRRLVLKRKKPPTPDGESDSDDDRTIGQLRAIRRVLDPDY